MCTYVGFQTLENCIVLQGLVQIVTGYENVLAKYFKTLFESLTTKPKYKQILVSI